MVLTEGRKNIKMKVLLVAKRASLGGRGRPPTKTISYHPTNTFKKLNGLLLVILLGAFCYLSCDRSSNEAQGPEKRHLADFRRVKQKARSWFDQLEVDPVLLSQKGIKGKKSWVRFSMSI